MRLKTKDSLFQMRFISLPRGASVFKGVKETAAIPSLEAPAHNTSNEHFVKKILTELNLLSIVKFLFCLSYFCQFPEQLT